MQSLILLGERTKVVLSMEKKKALGAKLPKIAFLVSTYLFLLSEIEHP
jgi:hypothetical protein